MASQHNDSTTSGSKHHRNSAATSPCASSRTTFPSPQHVSDTVHGYLRAVYTHPTPPLRRSAQPQSANNISATMNQRPHSVASPTPALGEIHGNIRRSLPQRIRQPAPTQRRRRTATTDYASDIDEVIMPALAGRHYRTVNGGRITDRTMTAMAATASLTSTKQRSSFVAETMTLPLLLSGADDDAESEDTAKHSPERKPLLHRAR